MTDLTRRIAELPPAKRELLLRRLAEQNQGAAPPALPALAPDPAGLGLPFAQTGVQQAYLTGRSGYFDLGACGTNFFAEYEVTGGGPAFLERFNQGLQRLIARHDALRTVLLPDGRQQILPAAPPYQITVIAGDAELDATRHRLKQAKADVYHWPLFEFVAFLLDDGRIRILSRIDAVILDGTSNALLIKELLLLLEDPSVELAPYACSFRDYALAAEQIRETELYAKSRAYWLERVKSLPPAPALPLAAPVGPETESFMVGRADYMLTPDEWTRFKARAAHASLTPSAAVLTALTEVFAAWSASPSFTISVIASYRFPLHPDINRMVGNFNSISLLAVDGAGGTFQERARRLQLQLSADLEHMYFSGFEAIREWNRLQGAGARAASPILANSLIEYSHSVYEARQLDRGGAETDVGAIALVDGHFTIPQVLIEPIFGVEPDGSLASQWYSLDAVFPPGMVEAMFGALKALLKRLADADAAWGERALHLYRRTFAAVEVVEMPCRVPPERAAGFTTQIRAAGVAPGSVVAWLAEPGADTPGALLGTWNAGCAFLPLDPAWPDAELQAALVQSGAALVLDPVVDQPVAGEVLPIDPESTACLLWRPGRGLARYSHRSLAATISGILATTGGGAQGGNDLAAPPPASDRWLTAVLLELATGESTTVLPDLGGGTDTALWTLRDGRPLPGFRVQVLSPALEDRPDWVAGQLWIDGAPTGRRARFRADGTVELLGAEAPAGAGAPAQPEPPAPRDGLEAAMAGLWAEVLGTGPIGVRDNFFRLGGTSLTALRLVAAVEARFGCRLPFTVFAEGPTVEHFANVVRQ